jgi:hypothetical protein
MTVQSAFRGVDSGPSSSCSIWPAVDPRESCGPAAAAARYILQLLLPASCHGRRREWHDLGVVVATIKSRSTSCAVPLTA